MRTLNVPAAFISSKENGDGFIFGQRHRIATNKKARKMRAFLFVFRFHRRGLKRRSETEAVVVDLNLQTSNQILEILEQWNTLLEINSRHRKGQRAAAAVAP